MLMHAKLPDAEIKAVESDTQVVYLRTRSCDKKKNSTCPEENVKIPDPSKTAKRIQGYKISFSQIHM